MGWRAPHVCCLPRVRRWPSAVAAAAVERRSARFILMHSACSSRRRWHINQIRGFFGEYWWLSNYWPVNITFERRRYASVEHAYHAAKTHGPKLRAMIAALPTPGEAKRQSRELPLRPDWEDIKLSIMESLLRKKFSHEQLRDQLLATGDAYLEETNDWGDPFWGVCGGQGENHFGRLLMKLRDALARGQ